MFWQLPLPSSVCKTQECHIFLKINFITAFIQIYNSMDLPFSFFLVLVSIEKIQLFRQRLSLLSVKANTKGKSPCDERPLTSIKEPLVTITLNNTVLSTLSCKLLHFCKRTFLERAYIEILKTVFDNILKHLKIHQKYGQYSATRHFFNFLLAVWKCGQAQSLVFDMVPLQTEWSRFEPWPGTTCCVLG